MLKNLEVYKGSNLESYKSALENQETKEFKVATSDLKLFIDSADDSLKAEIWGKFYPVRETALNSMLSRYRIGGEVFRRITDVQICKILNTIKEQLPSFVTVMICDGAVNSINSKDYVHLPMNRILDRTEEMLAPFFTGDTNVYVNADYSQTDIKFYTDKKFEFNGAENDLVIGLRNSECGDSSLSYGAFLNTGRYLLPIMSDMFIVHKGLASLDNVDEKLSQLEGVITQNVQAIKLLENVRVTSSITAIKEFGDQTGLPKKVVNAVVRQAETYDTLKASQIYAMFVEQTNEFVTAKDDRYKNDLLKLLRMNWSKYGTTETVEESEGKLGFVPTKTSASSPTASINNALYNQMSIFD